MESTMPSFLGKLARRVSTKQNIFAQPGAEDTENQRVTRMGVDLGQVIPKDDNDYSTEASINTKQPKAIKMGIDLARKLFHSSRDEHSTSPPRVDSIFNVHATQKEHILHRRNTTEDSQRPMKLNISKFDISKPVTSPPAPDETLVHRYEKRQADWKQRSMSFKNKKIDSVKRWSWKTWKPQAGQENTTNANSFNTSNTGEKKKLLPRDPIREPEDFLSQGPLARQRARSIHQLRAAGLEISVKPGSMPATFWDQRRNPLTSPTSLSVIEEQQSRPSFLRPTHCHAASATHFPRQHSLRHQALTKSASTSMLRPGEVHESHFDVHSLSRTSGVKDQRHIHPALRTKPSAKLSVNDQRHIHPALCTQPCPIPDARDQRHMHPTLRHEPSLRSTMINQRHIHPALRAHPSTTSLASSNTVHTTGSAPSISRSIPRVRIIPPTPLIGPDNIPTAYAERAILASKPPTQTEQKLLVDNMNASRAIVCVAPLELHPLLSVRAQDYVALQLPPLPPPKPTPAVFRRHESINLREARQRATQIEQIPFVEHSRASGIRLISPPGLGVLACAELWAGGKYKRHKTVRTSHVLEQHRYTLFPKFVTDDIESMIPMASHGHGHGHSRSHSHGGSAWCVCAEYDSWATVTDKRWKNVGIGCAEDGRWVVELWDPDTTGGAARSL